MDGKPGTSTQQSRISNADNFNITKKQEDVPDIREISATSSVSPEKVLKVIFASFLFLVVIGSGFIARISLHILIWHINPPTYATSEYALKTFGGLLTHSCDCISSVVTNVTCSSNGSSPVIDETWIWAVFLVIVAPYCLTFISTLFRIIFKTNKSLNWKVLVMVMVIETIHSVGLSILAFIVLPSFDPAFASVVYLAVIVLPPLFDIIDKIITERRRNDPIQMCSETSKLSLVFPFVGLTLQVAGLILIGLYMKKDWLVGVFVMASIFVSIKHWENFVTMGTKDSKYMRRLKLELQEGRTKVSCLVNLWKIIITFLAVIVIFTSRATDSLSGFKSLFNNGMSTLNGVFGSNVISYDPTCRIHVPFVVAIVNIICDYICYKATKTVCVIYCQRFGFGIAMAFLPIMTTFTLIGLMYNSTLLKLNSCDLTFSEWCLRENNDSLVNADFWLMVIAFVLLYLSIFIITRHVWNVNGYKHGETARIFASPFYCGVFLDISLMLNRRRNDNEYDVIIGKSEDVENESRKRKMLYACCATMWHETANEMTQLLKSLFRLDMKQYTNKLIAENLRNCGKEKEADDIEDFDFQAHIYFDDAFKPFDKVKDKIGPEVNDYVKTFIMVLDEAGSMVHGKQIQLPDGNLFRTPYGARIHYKLPGGNELIVHLKDKTKIRPKKRWSQVMYMFYILKWNLENKYGKDQMQEAAENTYLLALDGDVDFEPEAVISLMKRMNKSKVVGAACGRIHPIGSGPMVWYQQFEYAVSHWLQKATEHVIGCVLCSPGCFSLFRGSAILNHNVMETYTTVAKEAVHFLKYDQGEDRWLCTLLLKQGWKVEYCAESDAYTFAPEGFYEFYNQRRRWSPSTMANILDIIVDWRKVCKNNENISFLYIVYQVVLFVSTILTPGTIFMLILGAIIIGFGAIPPWVALILNLIPVAIFLLMTLYASSERQLQFAAVLSAIYSIVMVIVLIGVVKDAVEEGLCSTTTIFILFVSGVFVISAIVHPKEILCIMPGLLYFVAIPSMSMLMFLYSIGNLHVVSWGTRETKPQTETKDDYKKKFKPEKEEKGYFCTLGNFFGCIFCPSNTYSKEDFLYKNMMNQVNHLTGENADDEEEKKPETETDQPSQQSESTSQQEEKKESTEENAIDEFHVYADDSVPTITRKERKFWEKTIKKYLKPLEKDKKKEEEISEQLISLRNSVCLFVYLLNAILVTVMFGLTQVNAFKDSLTMEFTCSGDTVSIVPISILFAIVFGLLLLLQFLCMLYHRFSTLMHITASTDLFESDETKEAKMNIRMAEYLTNPVVSQAPKATSMYDKQRKALEMNRSVVQSKGKTFRKLDDLVRDKMKNIQALQGSLYLKHQTLARKVVSNWADLGKKNKWQFAVKEVVRRERRKKTQRTNWDEGYLNGKPSTTGPFRNKVAPIDHKIRPRRLSTSSTSSREELREKNVRIKDSDNETRDAREQSNDSNI